MGQGSSCKEKVSGERKLPDMKHIKTIYWSAVIKLPGYFRTAYVFKGFCNLLVLEEGGCARLMTYWIKFILVCVRDVGVAQKIVILFSWIGHRNSNRKRNCILCYVTCLVPCSRDVLLGRTGAKLTHRDGLAAATYARNCRHCRGMRVEQAVLVEAPAWAGRRL